MDLHRVMASCLTFAVAVTAAIAQQPSPPPQDPALADQLDQLEKMVKHTKMDEDFRAIGLIQSLAKVEQRHPKDVEKLAKALGEVFRTGKPRTGDKEVLYRETAEALAKLGEDGAKELAKAFGSPRLKDAIELQGHLLRAIGRTEDPKQVELLLETTLRAHQDELRAAAGEALGNYTKLELSKRREVVKGIIREWGGLHAQATTPDPTDPSKPIPVQPQNARRTLRIVEGKWVATLGKLTGTSNREFREWQQWLNKNPNWTPPEPPK